VNEDTGSNKKRRLADLAPVNMVFTPRQMAAVLGLVALLQTIGGKFVIDSYIDKRVEVHDRSPIAHSGMFAQKADSQHDGEEVKRKLEEVSRQLNTTNERLAKIEGAISAGRGGR
jgi:hypothetical protein